MQFNCYLTFNGQCEEAFKFYEKVLGGKIEMMMPHGGTPAEAHVPAEWRTKIMHASLRVGDGFLLASDVPPEHYTPAKGFHVAYQAKEAEEAERVYKGLSEGGSIQMPLQETFWATRFGMFTDRFGIPWMVNCGKPS
ncbi:MAG TPA: VOC family protein [Candidatus Angelobacter sp.]|nr:VOC family protein [Candidatus Angelobacter sp.]